MFSLIGPVGLPELLIILFIVLLVFGASRLPEVMGGLGKGIKNFKASVREEPTDKTKPES
ncbi:MAG: twin-arginine translocase TatA/TatE family subunit [Luteitalea sp.]|nr:twin-arginine translocase TatA/TatE family subunit [Luteitalea sp.]